MISFVALFLLCVFTRFSSFIVVVVVVCIYTYIYMYIYIYMDGDR